MQDFYLISASSALIATVFVSIVGLKAWRDWIGLKREELGRLGGMPGVDAIVPNANARIEVADLKERVRKLEAIASGVDL